jgi:hypothetical protein
MGNVVSRGVDQRKQAWLGLGILLFTLLVLPLILYWLLGALE